MKKMLIMALLGFMVCGCSLKEDTDIEINPKPTLVVEYRYTDKKGNNTTHEEVGHTASLLFDPAGVFLREITVFGERFTDSMTLLSGVPAGEYTVVSFANADGMECPALTPGVSGITELLCKKKDTGDNRTAVRLFHALTRFTVQRGRPQVRRIDLDKKYFRIELSVTGADKLSGNADDFCVIFDGIPAGIDYKGEPLQETMRFIPLLHKEETGTMESMFNVFCFGQQNEVRMTLRSKEETVGEISLSDYLARYDERIDYHCGKEVVIPIHIDVTSSEITVTVSDWDEAKVQIPVLGE